jgi:hypothetical protein
MVDQLRMLISESVRYTSGLQMDAQLGGFRGWERSLQHESRGNFCNNRYLLGVSVWTENAYLSIAALHSTIMALTSNVRLEEQSLIETVQRVWEV